MVCSAILCVVPSGLPFRYFVSNTKSLKYICGNFTFEAPNLHREKSTLEKIVPLGLIRNTNTNLGLFGGLLDLQYCR